MSALIEVWEANATSPKYRNIRIEFLTYLTTLLGGHRAINPMSINMLLVFPAKGKNKKMLFFVSLLFYVLATSKTYQDGNRLVTVRTYGNFIVLPHWETRLPAL